MQSDLPPSPLQLLTAAMGRPSSTLGLSVTPGIAPAKGSWVDLGVLHATAHTFLVEFIISSVSATNTTRNSAIDIGLDLAGGTSYVVLAADIPIGSPAAYNDATAARSTRLKWPLMIPPGARVAVRASQNNAAPTAIRVYVRAWGKPQRPESAWAASIIEVLGATAATASGTTLVPGTTSEGAWTQIGAAAITRDWKYIDFLYVHTGAAVTGQVAHVDIGWSTDGGTTIHQIIVDGLVTLNANEIVWRELAQAEYCAIPAGATIWARGQLLLGTVDAGQSVAVVGLG